MTDTASATAFPNTCSVSELNYIRDSIEAMNKFNQVEVLRIFARYQDSVTLNENKYGIHINLTELKETIIEDLRKYIQYVNTQEIELNDIEQQKEEYKNTYFTK